MLRFLTPLRSVRNDIGRGYGAVWPLRVWKVLLPAGCIFLGLVLSADRPSAQAADDHGGWFDSATNLPLGSSVSGRIDHGEDWDFFRLDLSGRPGSTDVWIYTTGNLDTEGWLYDSSENPIATSEDGRIGGRWNFHIRWVLPRGVYYVAVGGQTDSETNQRPTGNYRLYARAATDPGSTGGTATRLEVNSMAPGTIDTARDSDYFRMDLSETRNLVIRAVNRILWYTIDDESYGLLPVEPLAVEVLDSSGEAVSVNVYELEDEIDQDKDEDPYGFSIRDDFGPGTYYFKVTTPAGVTSHPVPYTIHAFEDTEYTKYIEDCEARTRSLNNPRIRDPLYACQWHLSDPDGVDANVEAAWAQGVTGEGISVAVVDDGMYHAHEDLRDNVDASRNHDYTGRGDIYSPLDHHGTHVAGVIAARDNGIGVRGVAPRATIYGYNYLAGPSTNANEANAMARNAGTTAVSNNSWGSKAGPGLKRAGSFWEWAVESGLDTGYGGKGVLYIFSGGNGHEEGDDSNLDEMKSFYGIAAVCAVNDHDTRSSYSEMGANLWVCAPSNDRSDLHQGVLTTENSDRYYEEFGGTSAAAPIVAGVAALMRDANPALTWRDLKLILAATARKNDPGNAGWGDGARKYGAASASDRYHFNREYGFGMVDAGAAVDLAKRWITAPPLQESSVSSRSGRAIPAPGNRGPVPVVERLTLNTGIRFTEFVEVEVDFDHTSFRDMAIELESPSGAVSKLAVPYDTREETDDDGNTLYIPLDGAFRFGAARHLGEDPNGEWKLRLTDTIAPRGGTLRSWSIRVYGHSGTPTAEPGDTAARLASAEGRLGTLEARLATLEATVARLTGTPPPTATPTPASRVIFGPVSGSIEHDPDDGTIDTYRARGVTTADAIIEARFHNPYSSAEGSWSSGFMFRRPRSNWFHAVIVTDNSVWYHYLSSGDSGSGRDRVGAGYSEHIDTDANGSNLVRVVADGGGGTLSVNGHHVADLDLSGLTEAGGVSAVAGYFTGDGLKGKSTRFEDFTIRTPPR